MTLVEVVGGLALLGALLTGILLARARYVRQSALAERKLQAVGAADALLAGWHPNPRQFPREATGVVPGDGQFAWRTRPVPNEGVQDLGAGVVRLEILDQRAGGAVLASVDYVIEPEGTTAAPGTAEPAASGATGRRPSRSRNPANPPRAH